MDSKFTDTLQPIGPGDAEQDEPVRFSPPSQTQRVYTELRRLIIEGGISPSQKLKISELRDRLNAGGTPIREALSLLTSDQLVERIDQRGFRAAPVSLAHFRELLELRCQLEPIALRGSLAGGGADWESRLSAAHQALTRVSHTERDRWEALHRGFHHALIDAHHSPILLRFCRQLYDLNIRYRHLAARNSPLGSRDVASEHLALLEAALERDADIACELLRQHYIRTGDYLAGQLSELEASAKVQLAEPL